MRFAMRTPATRLLLRTAVLMLAVVAATPASLFSAGDCAYNGDANLDGIFGNVADLQFTIDIAFKDAPPADDPTCSADRTDIAGCGTAGCDGVTDALDVAFLSQYLFVGGIPFADCFTAKAVAPSLALAGTAVTSQQNSVFVESKTVSPGTSGIEIGIYVENTIDLYGMVLPLELRAATPGAYFTPGSLTFAVQGRVNGSNLMAFAAAQYYSTPDGTNSCSGSLSSTWSGPSTSPGGLGTSPDALMWTGTGTSSYLAPGSDGIPGSGTPSFVLNFDVTSTPGSFEIDTCCVAPANHLLFIEDVTLNCVTPSFTKGVITMEAPGEFISNAIPISALPYTNSGSTAAYGNDYDESCGGGYSNSPDVVYRYDAATDETVDVILCNSGYDTKLIVYEDAETPGAPYHCNEDFCGDDGMKSAIMCLLLRAGHTYFFVVDGWNGQSGNYAIDVTPATCVWPGCTSSAIVEGEACPASPTDPDNFNGGCNAVPPVYSSIAFGDTVCGTSWAESGRRDTDWYRLTLTESTVLTWKATANFQFKIIVIYLGGNCAFQWEMSMAAAGPGDTASLTLELPPDEYVLWIGPEGFFGYSCGGQPWQYEASLTGYSLEGNRVMVESKTVARKATAQTVAISIANENDLAVFEIPLVARSLTGGAFWSANLDTLHAFGRLESSLTGIRTFRDTDVDYTSPDLFSLACLRIFDPCLGAGNLQQMTGLTFDVGSFIGSFEIDTAFVPPASHLVFGDCAGGPTYVPEFTKGLITVGPSETNGAPVAQCTAVITGADQDCDATVAPAAADNGSYDPDGDPFLMRLNPPGPYGLGVHEVWLVVDDTQDADSCQTTITVVDDTPPVIQCPGEIVVPNDPGECGAVVTFAATAQDNCAVLGISYSPPSGSLFTGGATTPVRCIAEDASGNADTCFFDVTVEACGAPNEVVIESRTVAVGETGVQLEIAIGNEVDLSGIVLPLVARNVSGGAFWAGDVDTVPAYGRLTSALTEIRVFATNNVDFTSPDPLILAFQKIVSPCVTSGPLQGMSGFVFDVKNKGGVFEIDTALYPPSNALAFATCVMPEEIRPDFTKGIVTVTPPLDGNQVVIESKAVDPGATGVTIEISIANENPLGAMAIPLHARSISGGAFWTNDVDTLPAHGRLTSTLTFIRAMGTSGVDYVSPDQLSLAYLSMPGSGCLSSGLLEGMITLQFDVTSANGEFVIDSGFVVPNALTFIDCPGVPDYTPDFYPGIITVGTPPTCQCDCHADPQCDGVTDVLDVVKAVNVAFRSADPIIDPSPSCPYQSTDANCSGFTDVIDVVKFVNVAFRGGLPQDNFSNPCP